MVSFKKLLGIDALEKRVDKNERLLKQILDRMEGDEVADEVIAARILEILEKPLTTDEIAGLIGKSRERTSFILNRLEDEKKVKEHRKKGRKLLYVRV